MALPVTQMYTKLPFGKFKGERVEEVLEKSPKYIAWAYDQTVFRFSDEVLLYLHNEYGAKLKPYDLNWLKEQGKI